MPRPSGTLTPPQLEILEAVWAHGPAGATIAELVATLSRRREVARTTVLTLVQRLERRGWLSADKTDRAHRYRATRSREESAGRLAAEFVDSFFGGSASTLVASLLGSKKIRHGELARLRELLANRNPGN